MGSFIEERGWQDDARAIAESSGRVVFPAPMVAKRFSQVAPVDASRTVINPQCLYLRPNPSETGGDARIEVRRELGLPPETAIVIGVGHADLRKGFDLFSQTAAVAASSEERIAFVWVGGGEWQLLHWLVGSQPDTKGRVIIVSHTEDVSRYYAAADALFVSSREDAFPSTVLEALAHGLPVVAFAGCTGTEELIERTGRVITAFDLNEAAAALAALTRDRDSVRAKARRTIVERDYAFTDYAFRLAQVAFTELRRISVAIPTYNYAHYLKQRLTSVFNQTHPVSEVTVLDDASTMTRPLSSTLFDGHRDGSSPSCAATRTWGRSGVNGAPRPARRRRSTCGSPRPMTTPGLVCWIAWRKHWAGRSPPPWHSPTRHRSTATAGRWALPIGPPTPMRGPGSPPTSA
jgi:hypothetical protein